jgi:hypothetical protein
MKTWIATTAMALLPLGGLAQPAMASCNLATLSGAYSYNFNGFLISGGSNIDLAVVGTINFDGAGKISGFDTSVVGGQADPLETFTGSYKVKEDCSGTFKLNTTESGILHAYFTIDSGGNEIEFVDTDPGTSIAGSAKRF